MAEAKLAGIEPLAVTVSEAGAAPDTAAEEPQEATLLDTLSQGVASLAKKLAMPVGAVWAGAGVLLLLLAGLLYRAAFPPTPKIDLDE